MGPPDLPTKAPALAGTVAPETALTRRQLQILSDMAHTGYSGRAVGKRLGISESTIKGTLATAYLRLGVTNRTAAFIALGWLTTDATLTPASLKAALTRIMPKEADWLAAAILAVNEGTQGPAPPIRPNPSKPEERGWTP